jgi:two-component system chemotaxis sensor kinase CheA
MEIGETFVKFRRVVHDLSKELGKEIQLIFEGADTEIDRNLSEKISDPLMHLVRNSMDHGLENPEERKANGKPSAGTLTLRAVQDSGSILIEVKDDGRGINRKRVLNRAIEKGLVPQQNNLTDDEICHLIFAPGFSTAETISNISGRGVGMDVVRSNIESVRGNVEVESIEGQGTTMRLRLPLTLAIIAGFLVRCADQRFVLPLDLVTECLDWTDNGERCIDIRGEAVPLISVRKFFHYPPSPNPKQNIVILKQGRTQVGLIVDDLMGEIQTVIKPLGGLFGQLRAISGSTILASGELALILDVNTLVEATIRRQHRLNPDEERALHAH